MDNGCFSQLNIHRDKPRAAVWGKVGRGKLELIICESDLGRYVFIDIACNNAVWKLAFVALNMWMIVKWKEKKTLC